MIARLFLAALAVPGLGLVAAGCGGGSGATTPTVSAAGSPTGRLIAYSACMRGNGVPTFPDPDRHGNLLFNPSEHIDPSSPLYKRAENACKKLGPEGRGGVGMTPAEHAKALAAMTRYVQCMRKNGVQMADPFSGPNGGVGIVLPRTIDPSSPLYKQADAACRRFTPGG